MSSRDPIAALEIGTSNTVLAIGEPEGATRIRIAALGSIPSIGVRKSHIIDIGQAAHSVDSVLKRVGRDFGYSIGHACLAISGPQIRVKRMVTQWQLIGKTVGDEDMREIYNRSLETGLDADERTLLDESEIGYGLDDLDDIPSPKGMTGHVLKRKSLCIHGDTRRVMDAKTAAQHAKLEIADAYFAGTCAATAVLSQADRNAGTLAIDMGGGSTSYTLYENGHLVHAGVIGVGGDHVTNDVRTAFSLTKAQAEELKKSASALVGAGTGSARLEVVSSTPGFDPVTVSRKALETIVNARLQELFAVILDDLDRANLAHRFNAGIVLTGGVSSTPAATALAERVFGRPARIGTFIPDIEPVEDGPPPATYATVAGLLLMALHDQDPQTGFHPIKTLLGGLFE
ncbi:MAG: cell division protein FtsA [Kiritimatiellae bacterium]|nr:cell division protein FtsA [Kiritimatiellia bacterium]